MLGVDERRHPRFALRFGDDMVAQRRLAGRLGSVYFNDTAARDSAHAQREIEAQRPGRDHLNGQLGAGLSQLHDGTLAELLLDLRQGEIEGSLPFIHRRDLQRWPASALIWCAQSTKHLFACQ